MKVMFIGLGVLAAIAPIIWWLVWRMCKQAYDDLEEDKLKIKCLTERCNYLQKELNRRMAAEKCRKQKCIKLVVRLKDNKEIYKRVRNMLKYGHARLNKRKQQ